MGECDHGTGNLTAMSLSKGSESVPARGIVSQEIAADTDDHVFIIVRQKDKPVLSIDLMNVGHRRSMGVRVNGMGVLNFYADVESPEQPTGERFHRYCPFCGEKYDLFSSSLHTCEADA